MFSRFFTTKNKVPPTDYPELIEPLLEEEHKAEKPRRAERLQIFPPLYSEESKIHFANERPCPEVIIAINPKPRLLVSRSVDYALLGDCWKIVTSYMSYDDFVTLARFSEDIVYNLLNKNQQLTRLLLIPEEHEYIKTNIQKKNTKLTCGIFAFWTLGYGSLFPYIVYLFSTLDKLAAAIFSNIDIVFTPSCTRNFFESYLNSTQISACSKAQSVCRINARWCDSILCQEIQNDCATYGDNENWHLYLSLIATVMAVISIAQMCCQYGCGKECCWYPAKATSCCVRPDSNFSDRLIRLLNIEKEDLNVRDVREVLNGLAEKWNIEIKTWNQESRVLNRLQWFDPIAKIKNYFNQKNKPQNLLFPGLFKQSPKISHLEVAAVTQSAPRL